MPETKMTDEEYMTVQNQVVLLAGLIAEIDLPGFLERIDRADTWGPILDPTLYRNSMRSMHAIQSVAQALNECRYKILKIRSQA